MSHQCAIRFCHEPPRHDRDGLALCDRHVVDADADRLSGSLIDGYRVKAANHDEPVVIERRYGPPRARIERVLIRRGDSPSYLTAIGRYESVRAVEPASLEPGIREAVEVLARTCQGHVEWLRD